MPSMMASGGSRGMLSPTQLFILAITIYFFRLILLILLRYHTFFIVAFFSRIFGARCPRGWLRASWATIEAHAQFRLTMQSQSMTRLRMKKEIRRSRLVKLSQEAAIASKQS